jgi:hypothetical protein
VIERLHAWIAGLMLLAALSLAAMLFVVPASAQAAATAPANSIASGYGRGWECAHGFTEWAASCRKISMPSNAFLNGGGDGWNCERGYRKLDTQCVKVVAPENANATNDTYTKGWACSRGFVERDSACRHIVVPANAFLTDASFGS